MIVGKRMPDEGAATWFGCVHTSDTQPTRRLFEVLKAQGMQANQQVTFGSAGGDTVRDLPLSLHPESEHLLDWFHCAMHVTVMRQIAKGLGMAQATIDTQLERSKGYRWHGNVLRALHVLDGLLMDREDMEPETECRRQVRKAVDDFWGDIAATKPLIPNYGDRYRHGERIAPAFVESPVNQVVSRRMVKKQPMRWPQRGAHLLLQVRTQTFNDDLRATCGRWYPGIQTGGHQAQKAA